MSRKYRHLASNHQSVPSCFNDSKRAEQPLCFKPSGAANASRIDGFFLPFVAWRLQGHHQLGVVISRRRKGGEHRFAEGAPRSRSLRRKSDLAVRSVHYLRAGPAGKRQRDGAREVCRSERWYQSLIPPPPCLYLYFGSGENAPGARIASGRRLHILRCLHLRDVPVFSLSVSMTTPGANVMLYV